eukprot:Sspe_Gene.65281::Locus_38653_Transcript_1_1_Confidence_1.000_Length_1105::g.65281::m.65281
MSCCPPSSHGYLASDTNTIGKISKAGDVEFYEVGEGASLIMIISDVWGWNSGHVRAIADEISKHGATVVIPKVMAPFEGGTSDDGLPPDFNITERFNDAIHLLKPDGQWHPNVVLPKLMQILDSKKPEKFGVLGFCYGGWMGMHLAAQNPKGLVAAASSHPSIHIEGLCGGNPAEVAAKSCCPWLLQPCGKPDEGGDPVIYDADGALFLALEKSFPGKNETKRFENMKHGFVVRGNLKEGFCTGSGDDVKVAIQEAVEQVVSFFKKNGLLS